jgi:myo-inositol-1(or 4)-monophosphatase
MPVTPVTPGTDELTELEQLAIDAATEAGRFILDERPAQLRVAETKSSATDVVTVMDQQAEQMLRQRITAARPHDAIVGEEAAAKDGESGVTWLIDPIDGTVNYLYGIPAYAVSVAAAVGDPRRPGAWAPVAGAVVNPVTGELYRAHLDGGAWLEVRGGAPRRLVVPDPSPDLGQALAGTGFGYAADRRAWQTRVLLEVIPSIRDIRRFGSAALDICAVATGTLDCYFERGLNPWDLAAAWVVLAEAGGVLSGLAGGPPDDVMVVGAAPPLHEQLERVVRAAAAEAGSEGTAAR